MYHTGRFFRFVRKRRPIDESGGIEVLLTGTFYSDAWIDAFLTPLAAAERCRKVVLVTTFAGKERPGIEMIYPRKMLRRVFGDVLARLLVFSWHAIRRRSELVGGFYISPNALMAELVGAMTGVRSMYLCVGGPVEVMDGGLHGESRIFDKLAQADPAVEKRLLHMVRDFDVIVPMGSSAENWFADNGVNPARIRKLTGAIDASRFGPPVGSRPVDLVFVGRLAPIKDLKLLLQTIRVIVDRGRNISLRIIGKGPQEAELKQFARDLELNGYVEFAGFVPDVAVEFAQAKCFVLTSKSEGVPLALIEAMLGGAVPVVANIGDLGDVVRNGENGILVDSREPADFANRINELLADDDRLSEYSQAAYNTGLKYDIRHVANDWNALLGEIVR
jgi:glycosyltransferase involved in cell wall biosynthesis